MAPPEGGAGPARNGHEFYSRDVAISPAEPGTPGESGGSLDAALKTHRNGGARASRSNLDESEIRARVRKLALKQLNRLVSLEPKVLRDEYPEAVHDLRVASRRLQSLVDFLYPAPRPPQVRKLRRRLKQAREVLGELRNQDVLLARMARVLARKHASRREAWEAGHDYVLKLRPKTAKRAHRELSSLNLAEVYVRLRQELTAATEESLGSPSTSPADARLTEQPGADTPPKSADDAKKAAKASARFARRLEELWKAFDQLAAKSRRDPGVLHSLRIATKRLRYLVEVAAALYISGSAEALHWLRDLQGKLGDGHDLEVLDATLIDMLARRKFLRDHLSLAIAVERLILSLRGSKTRHCHRYLRRAFQSASYRRTSEWVSQSAAPRPLPAG